MQMVSLNTPPELHLEADVTVRAGGRGQQGAALVTGCGLCSRQLAVALGAALPAAAAAAWRCLS